MVRASLGRGLGAEADEPGPPRRIEHEGRHAAVGRALEVPGARCLPGPERPLDADRHVQPLEPRRWVRAERIAPLQRCDPRRAVLEEADHPAERLLRLGRDGFEWDEVLVEHALGQLDATELGRGPDDVAAEDRFGEVQRLHWTRRARRRDDLPLAEADPARALSMGGQDAQPRVPGRRRLLQDEGLVADAPFQPCREGALPHLSVQGELELE